jgi:hypothetical protein
LWERFERELGPRTDEELEELGKNNKNFSNN